jgi:hypothetical protein
MRNEETRFGLNSMPQLIISSSSATHPLLDNRFGVMPFAPKQASHLRWEILVNFDA